MAARTKKARKLAAQKAVATRRRNALAREREAKKRSLAAKKGAATRKRNAAAKAKKQNATAIRRSRKPLTLAERFSRAGGAAGVYAKAVKRKKIRVPEGLETAPTRGSILPGIKSRDDLFALARASKRFTIEHLENLRMVDGAVYADTPAGRTYRFYTVETEAGIRGLWTTAKTFDDRLDPDLDPEVREHELGGDDGDTYEALQGPGVSFESEWSFDGRCRYRSRKTGRRCYLREGHLGKTHRFNRNRDFEWDGFP